MQGDPSQFFNPNYSERVKKEAFEYLETLLRPVFGDDWTKVAADKTTAETVRKLARARTEVERVGLFDVLLHHHTFSRKAVLTLRQKTKPAIYVHRPYERTGTKKNSTYFSYIGKSSVRTEVLEYA